MSRFAWGCAVYLPWFAVWVALEVTAVLWKGCPWPTLSRTAFDAEDRVSWLPVVFLAGLCVLTAHIAFRWPK